eukprot:5355788-Pyramimonas_sp.AAC.2
MVLWLSNDLQVLTHFGFPPSSKAPREALKGPKTAPNRSNKLPRQPRDAPKTASEGVRLTKRAS